MELLMPNLQKERVTFNVGDIVVWSNMPYIVLQRPTYCLASLKGDALACGTYSTLIDLVDRVNEVCRTTRDIQVFSKEDYALSLERSK